MPFGAGQRTTPSPRPEYDARVAGDACVHALSESEVCIWLSEGGAVNVSAQDAVEQIISGMRQTDCLMVIGQELRVSWDQRRRLQ